MTYERYLNYTNISIIVNSNNNNNNNKNNNNKYLRCHRDDCCRHCICCHRKIFPIANYNRFILSNCICGRYIMPIMWNILSTPTNRRYFKFKQFKYS